MTFQALKLQERFMINYPHKRIILTTTYTLNNISDIIDSIGIEPKDVFLKPFNFAELIKAIDEQ